jgi:hypothetical protein
MRNKYLYMRLVYSMAYVCAAAIFPLAYLGIPNDLLIAFAIACLVAGGFVNTIKDPEERPRARKKRSTTTFEQEMREARNVERAQA